VVAATNRDLDREVKAGRFREDLLYRLNVHVIEVPPLRARLTDLPLLVKHFLDDICERFGQKSKTATEDTLALLQRHDWSRNNVRELRNVVERLVIACPHDTITPEHIPLEIQKEPAGIELDSPAAQSPPSIAGGKFGSPLTRPGNLKELKAEAEKQIILAALERHDWHISRTAADLGLADHSSLLKIMRRHGLKRP
jgi:DNA-binding NtrC family response regulator